MRSKIFLTGAAVVIAIVFVQATQAQQTPFLERSITVAFNQERLSTALTRISQQGGFTFSYSPSILEREQLVTYSFTGRTVREILDQLFHGSLLYKTRGRYVILTKAPVTSSSKQPQIYTGYVVDEATGERLKNVSVYDPVTLTSAVTDDYGYFEIEINKPTTDLRLAINKQSYTDTLVAVTTGINRLLNISMRVDRDRIATFADSVGQKFKRLIQKTKLFTRQKVNMTNIDDTLYRKAQFSIIPFIGTNHALSSNVINDYSLNMLGGYSLGVRKVEYGGIFNLVEGNMHGAQFAGNFNIVGGNVRGVQFAGAFNCSLGKVRGAQFAGVFNVSIDSAKAVQLAGVMNINWKGSEYFSAAGVLNFSGASTRAVQLAGVLNFAAGDLERPNAAGVFNFATGNANTQLAGVYNFSGGNIRGWQASGVLNFAGKNVRGAQTAGVFNFSGKNVNGAQAAGVFNFATRQVTGVQVAGVFNYASTVHGSQLALLNIADSIKGVPVGLLSIVLKGYHKLEVSADEIFYTNVAFRTGVRQFYNIITAGARPATFSDDQTIWTFGYGVGTAPKLSRKLFLNVDLTSNQVVWGDNVEALNMINKAYVGVDFQVFKKMSFAAGVTLNAHITESTYEGYPDLFDTYTPHFIQDRTYSNDINMKMWLGGKIGIRFL